jgi:hypothetical protein
MDALKDIDPRLARICELKAQLDANAADYQARIDALSAPIQAQIDALWATIEPQIDALKTDQVKAQEPLLTEEGLLREAIQSDVLKCGKSIGPATFYKGRESWDGKGLGGYMVAHPEIEKFRKVGDPYVVWRNF